MTYKLYTEENRTRKIIPIDKYYKQLDIQNPDTDNTKMKAQLLNNEKFANCINENMIDIMIYASF